MKQLKTLVVYYSRTGNTKQIGDELAAALSADVEELRDGKNRKGPIGFLRSGIEAKRNTPVQLEALAHNPAEYDVVVVGSPIWANGVCTPVRTFLAQHKHELKRTAWFCTSGSINPQYAGRGFEAMTQESGLTPLATLGLGRRDIRREHAPVLAAFAASLKRER